MKNFKNFLISELFTPERGKSIYTRSYGLANAGPYPVYSASRTAPLCSINSYKYAGRYLTWTANGYGGRVQIIDSKFSVNGDRGVLVPKPGVDLDLVYIKHVLEPLLIEQAIGRLVDGRKNGYTKVSPEIVMNTA